MAVSLSDMTSLDDLRNDPDEYAAYLMERKKKEKERQVIYILHLRLSTSSCQGNTIYISIVGFFVNPRSAELDEPPSVIPMHMCTRTQKAYKLMNKLISTYQE